MRTRNTGPDWIFVGGLVLGITSLAIIAVLAAQLILQ